MARVTINDCLTKINNHFQLVLVATVRAREILTGKSPNIPREKSTVSVIALREIAEDAIDIKAIKDKLPYIFDTTQDINSKLIDDNLDSNNENHIVDNKNSTLLVIEEIDGDTLLSSE